MRTSPAGGVRVAVLARRARLGVGKTRLAEDIGAEATLRIYRFLIARTAAVVAASGLPATVFFADDGPGDEDVWRPGRFRTARQVAAPLLGDRLLGAAREVLAEAETQGVLLVGTDCPGLTPDLLREAAVAVAEGAAALGPSVDGGYYLLGVPAAPEALFAGIPWSSPDTGARQKDALHALGWPLHELRQLRDIDEVEDWRAFAKTDPAAANLGI